MFVVSFHEQNLLFNLHKAVDGKFESYIFTKNGSNEITGARSANPVNQLTIYGYMSRNNAEIRASNNIYYGDYFSVMEVDDKAFEHLMAEWGTANPVLQNGVIFGEKTQANAIAKAKSRIAGGGLASLDTGARPLSINTAYKASLEKQKTHLPEHKEVRMVG
jgi:hypothetical protein